MHTDTMDGMRPAATTAGHPAFQQMSTSAPNLLPADDSERAATYPASNFPSKMGGFGTAFRRSFSLQDLAGLADSAASTEHDSQVLCQKVFHERNTNSTPVLQGQSMLFRRRKKDSKERRAGAAVNLLLAPSHALRIIAQRDGHPACSLEDLDRSSVLGSMPDQFAGPLAEVFPTGLIDRPKRHTNQAAGWLEVMAKNERWPSHHAEESGLVTFWQASLVLAREIRVALGALISQARQRTIEEWMTQSVLLILGQLVNSFNLSWEIDHEKHIKRIPLSQLQSINVIGMKHRHQQINNRLWAVIEVLESSSKKNAGRVLERHAVSALEKYDSALVYLLCTGKILLEDSLHVYRTCFSEATYRGLGHADHMGTDNTSCYRTRDNKTAVAYMAALTPQSQLMKRFTALGYSPWTISTSLQMQATAYRRRYLKPMYRLIQLSKTSKAATSPGSFVSSSRQPRYFPVIRTRR